MSKAPLVPPELKSGPFTLEEARAAGLSRYHLRSKSWRRVGPALYVWSGLGEGALVAIRSAQAQMPPTAAFKALTAAWLYGFEVVGIEPIEVINPHSAGIAARAGLSVSRAAIDSEDLAIVRGFRVTTIERTIADLSAQLPIEEAVVIADIALHRGLTTIEALRQKARCRRRMPGVRRFREVIDLANGAAESPMETRLRLLFKSRQLPEPWLQERLVDEKGRAIGRVDFYFPQARLVVEYDGEGHRERMVEDLRRQNRLLNAGYLLLRFTAPDVVRHPDLVVEQVRAALASRRR